MPPKIAVERPGQVQERVEGGLYVLLDEVTPELSQPPRAGRRQGTWGRMHEHWLADK